MTYTTDPRRGDFEYPDEAGYPDGVGTLSQDQTVLIDEVIEDAHAPAISFFVVNDEDAGSYEAIVGDTAIAGLTYHLAGDDRLVLLATAVFPEFRNQGIATELIRRVLDDVRMRGKTVTIMCPIVWAFIERKPEYADIIDPKLPGVSKGPHTSTGVHSAYRNHLIDESQPGAGATRAISIDPQPAKTSAKDPHG
ncbi:GNAT family N-acetyltransferase [Leifsonia sp. NPDC058248]|uniref:GNAT family N-acetyltransferase n=1 Tax=Leifsonia sp. NPDC058248 TaxID=3346402 RepID=UPI0036D97921